MNGVHRRLGRRIAALLPGQRGGARGDVAAMAEHGVNERVGSYHILFT